MKIGDRVILKQDIHEEGEDLPPGRIACKGDEVIIKRFSEFGIVVHHEGVDGGFYVSEKEIREK